MSMDMGWSTPGGVEAPPVWEGSTLDGVRQVIAEVCALDAAEVREEGFLLGYNVDSLRKMELLIGLEETFGIEVSEQDPRLRQVRTVGDLAAFVDGVRVGAAS
jgi:acyl carrier protein